jgi:probable selenium-dependent hydroxylase accessory protein YqeC
MTLIDDLNISEGSIVAVIGCGGKTSLIELIADKFRHKKTLVSTTTKMYPMKMKEIMLCETLEQCGEHEPQTGIQCLGLLNAASGKLESLPESFLAELMPRYDVVLLEADGSRGLPCKGWLSNEPAIPAYCTHTVGIVTMNPLGKAADEASVHRLREFLTLTGLKEGEPITPYTLEAMVCAPDGMFKNSAGRRYLLVNQVEDHAASRAALSFLGGIKRKYPNRFEKLLYGSVHLNSWQEA